MKKHPWISTFLLILILSAMFIYLRLFSSVTFQDIITFTPSSPALAALIILALFAIKSLTILLPLTLLFVVSASLFSFPYALFVNFLGLSLSFSIAYGIGRFTAEDSIDNYLKKYKKLSSFNHLRNENKWLFAYILKLSGFIPNDISSLIAGALQIPFFTFLSASILAKVPSVYIQTQLGAAALSDESIPPILWIASIVIILGYVLFYRFLTKKHLNHN